MRPSGILSILIAVLGHFFPVQASAEPLKAVTWNIEWFPGGKPNPNAEEKEKQTKLVTETLVGIQPDILLAQDEKNPERAKAQMARHAFICF